jgi:hypothetical protein
MSKFGDIRHFLVTISAGLCFFLAGCALPAGDPELTRNTVLELVDWHITGLWIINCPVAWVRVTNNNSVPIKEVVLKYYVYDENGVMKNEGDFTIPDSIVQPGVRKDFIELYLGVTDLHSERLKVTLYSVDKA